MSLISLFKKYLILLLYFCQTLTTALLAPVTMEERVRTLWMVIPVIVWSAIRALHAQTVSYGLVEQKK